MKFIGMCDQSTIGDRHPEGKIKGRYQGISLVNHRPLSPAAAAAVVVQSGASAT